MRVPLVFTVVQVPLALAFALLLHQPVQARGLWRAVYFLPSILPQAAYAVTFLWSWNDLFNPLIYLQSEELVTLPVGLLYFIARAEQLTGGSIGQQPWHLVMTLATVMVLPVIAVFVVVQRRFIEGVAAGGVKG